MALVLPKPAFTDLAPTSYTHAMTGSMLAGGDVALEFWPYLHEMTGSMLAGADTTLQFIGTDYYDMVASMLAGGDMAQQFITVTEYSMVASMLAGGDIPVATATAYEPTFGLKGWADTTLVFPYTTVLDTLAAHTLAAELLSGPVATLSATLPAHTVAIELGWMADLALPAHESAGEINSGNVYNATTSLPPHRLNSTLVSDIFSSAALTLPAHTLSVGYTNYPLLTSTGDSTLPAHTLSASETNLPLFTSTAAPTLPAHTIDVEFWAGSLGEASLILTAHTLSASAYSGSYITAENDVPVHTLEAAGFGPYTTVAALILLPHTLSASAVQDITAAFRAWALNLRKAALTEYTPFTFNSFASFNGKVYAAGSGGIRELGSQDDDAGTNIDATVRTGQHNFGTSFNKRVPRLYLGYKATGDLEVRTITGEDGRRSYLLDYNGNPNIHQRRVPIGRGPKSPYWQFEVINRGGADFLIDHVLAYSAEVTRRRVL